MYKVLIQIQYFEGCPNVPLMISNVEIAIKDFEQFVWFEKILVENNELANELKFRGSPTLLINDIDLEYMPEPLNITLSCRVYQNGVPNAETIKNRILEEISKIKLNEE